MEREQQSHRHLSRRNGGPRPTPPRAREGDHPGDTAAANLVDEFRASFRAWANSLSVAPNKLFAMMPEQGRKVHWARERYFGGVTPSPSDVEWVRLKAMGTEHIVGGIRQEIRIYRYAVEEMCRVCTGGSEGDTPALCPDAICPLRGVSPLELSPRAAKSLPLSADEVD